MGENQKKHLFLDGKSLVSPPGYQDSRGWQRIREGLAEPWVWLGLENSRGLVGPDQFFLQKELSIAKTEYVAHCYISASQINKIGS
jgi:hypothetical protein